MNDRAPALPLWPVERAGEALVAAAAGARLPLREAELGRSPAAPAELDGWLVEAGAWLGVEVEAVDTPYEMVARTLAAAAPALIRVPTADGGGLLAVVGATSKRMIVVDRDLRRVTLPLADVAAALCSPAVAPVTAEIEAVVERAGLAGRARARATAALLAERMRERSIGGLYLLRLPPEASPAAHARDQRFVRRAVAALALHAFAQLMWVASWWAIGRSVLGGTVSAGWLIAWGILLASSQAVRVAVVWLVGRLGIDLSAWLSQRLLAGALRTDPDLLKHEGVGVALGRVLESSAVHALAIGGGTQTVLATVELVFAGVVLALGAGGALHVVLLAATLVLGGVAMRQYLHARRTWTAQRLDLTYDLAEAMVGHATRLAQADLDALAERDDRALVRYLGTSQAVDRSQWWINVMIPRGWPILAALGLIPALVFGHPGASEIAVALGGILYALDGLGRLTDGATRIADATIAWKSIEALFEAAAASPDAAPPVLALEPASANALAIDARALSYRYAGRGAPVLAGCDLSVERGDRVLIEGPSGSGKSTLAAMLAGMRRPDSGLVLAGGLDRASVGAFGWRRRVACAPQFHDNHVFGGTLLFNVLMGRGWPPTNTDIAAAEAVCRDLGLGPLLDRMPAGLHEQVGETGWQLSHGERSRVFLARALLQAADVVLLDESMAALDPENLAISLRCIEAHAPTAIVIAHP